MTKKPILTERKRKAIIEKIYGKNPEEYPTAYGDELEIIDFAAQTGYSSRDKEVEELKARILHLIGEENKKVESARKEGHEKGYAEGNTDAKLKYAQIDRQARKEGYDQALQMIPDTDVQLKQAEQRVAKAIFDEICRLDYPMKVCSCKNEPTYERPKHEENCRITIMRKKYGVK